MEKCGAHNLLADEQQAYLEHGYFVRSEAFTPEEVTELNAACDAVLKQAKLRSESANAQTYLLDKKRFTDVDGYTVQFEFNGTDDIRVIEPVCDLHSSLEQLVDDPRLCHPMAALLNTERLSLWTAKLNTKGPGSSAFGWHQDTPYWVHDHPQPDQLPNVMVTLDPQDSARGGFSVIPRSHVQGCLPGTDDGTQLGGFYTEPSAVDATQQETMQVAAGSLIFFHPSIIHGSAANQTQLPRRALILTYQAGTRPLLKKPWLTRSVSL